MKKLKTFFILYFSLLIFLTACGGGGGGGGDNSNSSTSYEHTDNQNNQDNNQNQEHTDNQNNQDDNQTQQQTNNQNTQTKTITISGKAIDGYIKNATVCLDLNENDSCDNDEPTTTTNDSGEYSFETKPNLGYVPVVIIGGVDSATNENFEGILKEITNIKDKPISSIYITPLTTLSSQLYQEDKTNLSPSKAKEIIASNLGIDKDKINKNPLEDKELFIKSQQVIQTIKILKSSIQKQKDLNNTKAFSFITKQIAQSIKEDSFSKDLNISKVFKKIEDKNITTSKEIFIFQSR